MIFKGFIYCVICLITGKWYFGQTIYTIEERWKRHVRSSYRSSNHKFHRAIRKYGAENFIIEEVMFVESPTKEGLKCKLDYLEQHFIRRYDTKRNGYNSTDGGDGIQFLAKESLLKISNALKGRKFSEETRRKKSEAAKKRVGRLNSNYGNHKIAGANHYLFGKHLSEETKKKLSISRTGKDVGHKPYNYRKIVQLTVDGEVIKEWTTITEVKTKLKLNGHTLRKKLNSSFSYRGFIWKDIK